jgi:hypothetical protein
LTVLLLLAQFKMRYWWLVTWLDLIWHKTAYLGLSVLAPPCTYIWTLKLAGKSKYERDFF